MLDIIGVLNVQDDYKKGRNYWKYLKTKVKNEDNELVSLTNQLKLYTPDGKRRMNDVLDSEGVTLLAKQMPNTNAAPFLDWFTYSDDTIDIQSKKKAYQLFESGIPEPRNNKMPPADSCINLRKPVRFRRTDKNQNHQQRELHMLPCTISRQFSPRNREDA